MFVNSDFSDLLSLFNANSVKNLSRKDLITVKKASGRPQDLIDADLLSQSPSKE